MLVRRRGRAVAMAPRQGKQAAWAGVARCAFRHVLWAVPHDMPNTSAELAVSLLLAVQGRHPTPDPDALRDTPALAILAAWAR